MKQIEHEKHIEGRTVLNVTAVGKDLRNLLITFTDDTFIAIGGGYDLDAYVLDKEEYERSKKYDIKT